MTLHAVIRSGFSVATFESGVMRLLKELSPHVFNEDCSSRECRGIAVFKVNVWQTGRAGQARQGDMSPFQNAIMCCCGDVID